MVEGGRAEGGQAPANLGRERRGEGAPRPTRPLGVPASRSPFFFLPPSLPPSRRYQYQATTAEDAMAATEPTPFADFFTPTADSFVGSLSG